MALSPAPLPLPLTSFIGRERELGDLDRLLDQARLVTLVGAGGCGKTRLALELCARKRAVFGDAIAFADLAPLISGDLVAPAVLRALALREQAERTPVEEVVAALRDRRFLLVLDNAEHVLDACATLADALLTACPLLTLLVTSRERLHTPGEQLYEVTSLTVPRSDTAAGESEAERLFLARARARTPQLALTPQQAAAVGEICRRLDGLPLAVELAAARVAVLSIEQIAARLAERFRLLISTDRGLPTRQRTLRAAVEWSVDLLTERERAVFFRASVFAGAFTLDAAEAVCADDEIAADAVLDLLARLAEQSLLQVDVAGPTARYRLLETLRLYGRERLRESGQADAALARHAAYFLSLAETGASFSLSHERIAWLDRLEQQIDDLRQALRWLLDVGESEQAVRLAAALLQLCWVRGYMSEGRRWLRSALARGGTVDPRARAAALRAEGQLAYAEGDFDAARVALQESVALYEELGDEAGAHAPRLMLGAVHWEQGRFDQARAAYDQILASARARQDGVRTAESLVHVGLAALGQGRLAEARATITEALRLYEALALQQQAYIGLGNLGAVAHAEGKLAEARRCYEAALAGLEETGFQLAVAAQLDRLADLARREGRLAEARVAIRRSLRLRADLAGRAGFAEGLATAGMLAEAEGEPERAARLLGAAERRRQQLGMALLCFYQDEHARIVAALRDRLGPTRLAHYWAQGGALSQDEALDLVERPTGRARTPAQRDAVSHTADVLDLSMREREVLRHVAADLSNKEIAGALGLSVRTVEQHLRNIYAKLGVQGRAGAASTALRLGLIATTAQRERPLPP